jgi:hypothetical protein
LARHLRQVLILAVGRRDEVALDALEAIFALDGGRGRTCKCDERDQSCSKPSDLAHCTHDAFLRFAGSERSFPGTGLKGNVGLNGEFAKDLTKVRIGRMSGCTRAEQGRTAPVRRRLVSSVGGAVPQNALLQLR